MEAVFVCKGKQKISTVLVTYWQCLMLHMFDSINKDVNPPDL